MLISAAYAATEAATTAVAATASSVPEPEGGNFFMSQMIMILVLVALFYVLLIMPQQKRFKEHKAMIDQLKKGDSVVTSGGLVGKIHEIGDKDEVVIDLGEVKVTALRSTIQTRGDGKKPGDAKSKDPVRKK